MCEFIFFHLISMSRYCTFTTCIVNVFYVNTFFSKDVRKSVFCNKMLFKCYFNKLISLNVTIRNFLYKGLNYFFTLVSTYILVRR